MKELRTEIIAICDYATISREGKVSIIGIFDELRSQQFPAGLAKGFLVATLSGTPNKAYKLKFQIENEGKVAEGSEVLNMDIRTSENGKNNIVIELLGARFPKEGPYKFKIYDGGSVIGATELKVIHVKENRKQEVSN